MDSATAGDGHSAAPITASSKSEMETRVGPMEYSRNSPGLRGASVGSFLERAGGR